MYGGKNTLIGTSVDRREACSPDVILSKNLFFDSFPGQAGPVLAAYRKSPAEKETFRRTVKIKSHFFRRHVRRKKYLDRDKCRPQGGMQSRCYSVEKLVFRQFPRTGRACPGNGFILPPPASGGSGTGGVLPAGRPPSGGPGERVLPPAGGRGRGLAAPRSSRTGRRSGYRR